MSTKYSRDKIATKRVLKAMELAFRYVMSGSDLLSRCRAEGRLDVYFALHEVNDWLFLADDFWLDE